MNAQVKIHVRNCTEKIVYLKSYNSWDTSMSIAFPGKYGRATLTQIWGITAENPGEGETAEVRCAQSDPFHWKKHNSCKVKFKCDGNTPCPETTKTLEAGNWVYFSSTDIQKGDKCYKIGAE